MKKKDDLLWRVLRATTNSPNDVWKKEHYERHDNAPKELLGKQIYRYTVPIKRIMDIKDDSIYLVVQFCTDDLDFPYFVIDKNAFTDNLNSPEEYVYAFNVRLCFKSEFTIRHRHQYNVSGEVKPQYRAGILNDAINIIRDKPRSRIMKLMMDTRRYEKYSFEYIKKIILKDQFDNAEKEFKGVVKKKKNIDK